MYLLLLKTTPHNQLAKITHLVLSIKQFQQQQQPLQSSQTWSSTKTATRYPHPPRVPLQPIKSQQSHPHFNPLAPSPLNLFLLSHNHSHLPCPETTTAQKSIPPSLPFYLSVPRTPDAPTATKASFSTKLPNSVSKPTPSAKLSTDRDFA